MSASRTDPIATPASGVHSTAQPDIVRQLALQSVLQLADHDEPVKRTGPDPAQAEALMATLTPEQRERVFHVAGRRLAMQLLYELDLSTGTAEGDPALVLAKLATVDGLGPFQGERVRALVVGAWTNRKSADAVFAEIAPEWPTHRLAAIDRAILRLGHFEASSKLTPARIVIHECIELARAFGTDKSPSFVNALLDKALQAVLGEPAQGAT
jgi:N utilization substance protein B